VTESALEVVDGGLLTTVQDEGRPTWTHLGVPVSGAADQWSLAVANLLVGNERGAAVLEMTVVGPTLLARAAITIGLAGSDLGARIKHGRSLAVGRSHRLAAGDVLTFDAPGAEGGTGSSDGVRGYLAIAGGVDVPLVLGSRSTCLAGGFGGLAGRALRPGDLIDAGLSVAHEPGGRAGRSSSRSSPDLVWPKADDGERPRGADTGVALRLIGGPDPGIEALVDGRWRVGSAFDRVGVRLDGEALADGIGGETTTHGMPWGAVQVPPDGRPILLGADHQTTGGYRVLGVVISADLPILGQLRPGTAVRLVAVDRAEALAALAARQDALVDGAAALRDAAGWGALIDSAGA
jgi:biotin-dependent carboxylase-like uncharacterized protein